MSVQLGPAQVTVDGVQLALDDGSVQIVPDTLTGWYDGPDTKTNFTTRPGGHGAFDGQAYRDVRVVTVAGNASADSRAAVMLRLHALTGILAEGDLGPITVADPDYGTLTAQCRLSAGPVCNQVGADTWRWQFSVTAPDPRLYATTVTASTGLPAPGSGGLAFSLFGSTGVLDFGSPGNSGQVTLTNPGSADAYPVFTITGPVLGGFTLTDVATGRTITYSDDVPSGSTVLIVDSANGTATLNGADRTGELTTKQWWAVPRNGGSSTVQFNTLGASGQSGSMSASLQPAYW